MGIGIVEAKPVRRGLCEVGCKLIWGWVQVYTVWIRYGYGMDTVRIYFRGCLF